MFLPLLTGASSGGVSGTAAAGASTVPFFGDASPAGARGRAFLGSLAATLPGGGPFTFTFTPAGGVDVFTATLTDSAGNTSAFSNAVAAP